MIDSSFNILVKVYGRVQGVGFRAWIKKNACKLSLTGWVKNCNDNTVECEVSGRGKDLDIFLKECEKGPLLSNVKKISFKKNSFKKFNDFTIYYK